MCRFGDCPSGLELFAAGGFLIVGFANAYDFTSGLDGLGRDCYVCLMAFGL